jgi:hypothetical protein
MIRLLVWLVFIETVIVVPLWLVLRACRGQGRPLWLFVTRREL